MLVGTPERRATSRQGESTLGQPIVHFEIMGKDAVGLQKFYADLFSWKVGEPAPEMGFYGLVDGGSSGLAGGIGQDQDGGARVTIYVQVPELQATRGDSTARIARSRVCLGVGPAAAVGRRRTSRQASGGGSWCAWLHSLSTYWTRR